MCENIRITQDNSNYRAIICVEKHNFRYKWRIEINSFSNEDLALTKEEISKVINKAAINVYNTVMLHDKEWSNYWFTFRLELISEITDVIKENVTLKEIE